MIHSIGVDIVDIDRIEEVINRWGDKFLNKILTPLEYQYCRSKAVLAPSVAARFAVKEAVYKALPVFIQPKTRWLHIEVDNELSGKPRINFKGVLDSIKKEYIVHVSISHSKSSAVAVVVFEKVD